MSSQLTLEPPYLLPLKTCSLYLIGVSSIVHVVVETSEFLRRAKECGVSDAERAEIVDCIAANPMAGDEISGTGGARKVRFARRGQGKSGGYRVITFYSGVDIPVFFITMFAKNEKSNISQAEKNAMRKGLKALAEHYRGKEDDKGR